MRARFYVRSLASATSLASAVWLGSSSCYAPTFPECAVACDKGGGCPDGMACSNGYCTSAAPCPSATETGTERHPEPCSEAEASRCAFPASVERCDESTATWVVETVCGGDQPTCRNARCAACAPRAVRCASGSELELCGEAGTWDEERMECPVHAPVCAGTECRPKLTVTAGSAHACALTATGELWCWGDNARGQLGAGDSLRRGSSLEDPPLVAVDLAAGELRGVSAGGSHTCAWLDDGSVRCWGGNSNGELGLRDREDRGDEPGELGTALPVVDFGPVRAAIAVSAGGRHTCALFDDGAVKCWGANESGQRGLGHVHAEVGAQGDLPSVDLGPEAHVIQIDAGEAHTCALLAGGRVKCWGSNEEAQLGIGSVETRGDEPEELGEALPSVALPVETPAVQVSAGDTHSCALLADGEVWCWGSNTAGQLGTGTTSSRGRGAVGDDPGFLSVDLGEGVTALAVSAGANHSCALLADRRVKCWGINQFGALGIGERSNSRGTRPDELGDALPSVDFGNTPLLLAALVSAGVDYTCASLGTEIKCFGVNTHGQLGIGDNAARGDNPAELGAALPPVALPAP